MIKLVIFDFDDRLCLTEEACFNLENKIAADMGFLPMTRKTHQANWGKFLGDAIAERIPGIDPVEFLKRQEEYFSKYMSESGFDSIKQVNLDVLDKLKKAGKKLAILTNRSLVEVKHLIHEDQPLSSRLDFFYYKDILDYHKPDPRAFDHALKYFKVKPEEVVYVGDSLGDAHAAKNARMHFIAVLESGIRTKKDFKDIPVDFFTRKLPIFFHTYLQTKFENKIIFQGVFLLRVLENEVLLLQIILVPHLNPLQYAYHSRLK